MLNDEVCEGVLLYLEKWSELRVTIPLLHLRFKKPYYAKILARKQALYDIKQHFCEGRSYIPQRMSDVYIALTELHPQSFVSNEEARYRRLEKELLTPQQRENKKKYYK